LLAAVPAGAAAPPTAECVFVLHGLARGARSMARLSTRLSDAGFVVHNFDYPSTSEPFARLVDLLEARVDREGPSCAAIHFVTYSLGSLVVRAYLERSPPARLGRVVMIAPPNHGSEIVDSLGDTWIFRTLLGPVAPQLGTSPQSVPNRLGPPRYALGIIAGDRANNPVGWLLLPPPHDGTVSVASARLDGMSDFIVVHRSHTFIVRASEVAIETIAFLRTGRFESDAST
jgi:hypothetical protein